MCDQCSVHQVDVFHVELADDPSREPPGIAVTQRAIGLNHVEAKLLGRSGFEERVVENKELPLLIDAKQFEQCCLRGRSQRAIEKVRGQVLDK